MRYTETRIMLDFTRSAHQIFNPELSVISDKGLLELEIRMSLSMANKDASVVAFVREGELWTHAPESGKICGRIQLSQKC